MNKCQISEINIIKNEINKGEVIAIPTDTIYGVGSNISSYDKIIKLKKRDKKPLAILCHSIEEMQKIINIPLIHIDTLKSLTPGALTIVGKTINPKFNINKGIETTGVRIPNHKSLLKLLAKTGPLVVSSANISGEIETYSIEDVEKIFGNQITLYVENDQKLSKTASTVLNINTLEIYRSGENCNEIVHKLKKDLK